MRIFSFGEQSITEIEHALVQMPIRAGILRFLTLNWFSCGDGSKPRESKSGSVSAQQGFVIIMYLTEGMMEITNKRTSYILRPGDIYMIRHRGDSDKLSFHFGELICKGFTLWLADTCKTNTDLRDYFPKEMFAERITNGVKISEVSSKIISISDESQFEFYHVLLANQKYELETLPGEQSFLFVVSGPVFINGVETQSRSFANISYTSGKCILNGTNANCNVAIVQVRNN